MSYADTKLKAIEKKLRVTNEDADPFKAEKSKTEPFYSSGARCLIRMGGKPLGVCQDFRYSLAYQTTPIYTIDTVHAWDIDVGALTVNGTLSKVIDPTKGPEVDGLFHTMSSAVHQPLIEMQIIDAKLGTSVFFARGMFTQVTGNFSRGQLNSVAASFVGTAYQHYVAQAFKPYNSIAGGLSGLAKGLQNLASNVTGGIF